jgi:hypothetical protein
VDYARAATFNEESGDPEAYWEALLCIPYNPRIGKSRLNSDGTWRTQINNREYTDYEVFVLGWGQRIAEQIKAERNLTTAT